MRPWWRNDVQGERYVVSGVDSRDRKQMDSGGGTRRILVSYETTGRYR